MPDTFPRTARLNESPIYPIEKTGEKGVAAWLSAVHKLLGNAIAEYEPESQLGDLNGVVVESNGLVGNLDELTAQMKALCAPSSPGGL